MNRSGVDVPLIVLECVVLVLVVLAVVKLVKFLRRRS